MLSISFHSEYLSLECSKNNSVAVKRVFSLDYIVIDTTSAADLWDERIDEGYHGCDGKMETTWHSSISCFPHEWSRDCGLRSGFIVTPPEKTDIVVGLRICTGNDWPACDPLRIILAGSNETDRNLWSWTSWSQIFDGPGGLEMDPGRNSCGSVVSFDNHIRFNTYLFLVIEKRDFSPSVQFSEVKLIVG